MSDRQTGRLLNAKIKHDYLCAQCHSILTEIWDDSIECRLRVVCSKNHDHEGHISKARAESRRQRELVEGQELYRVFPALSGYKEPTPEQIEQDYADLF